MAIGKESIKRAVNATNIGKETNVTIATTQRKEEPTLKKTSNQVKSQIKSDLPFYLL